MINGVKPQLRPWLRLRLQLYSRLWLSAYNNILINRSQAVPGSFSVELWHANAARIVRSLHAINSNVYRERERESGRAIEKERHRQATAGRTPVNRACANSWLIRRVNVNLALLIEFLLRWCSNSNRNSSSNSCNQVWRLYCSVTRSWQVGASSKRSQLAFNTHIGKSLAQKTVCCIMQRSSRQALRGLGDKFCRSWSILHALIAVKF